MEHEYLTRSANPLVRVHGGTNVWKQIFSFLGPAFLISVGYMDPGNWATDIAAGSALGYSLLWVLLLSNIMALILQYLSVKLGIVAKMDLAKASRMAYSKPLNFFLYCLAEVAIIACDLAEVIGMAIGLNLLFRIPLLWGVLITLLDTVFIFFVMRRGTRQMEGFILGLVFVIGVSFLAELILAKPQTGLILNGFVPSQMNDLALYMAIGIIGATVMPHNLYLHSSLVQSRKLTPGNKGVLQALRFNLLDTGLALNLAFFVNTAILILAASAFYMHGFHKVEGIAQAHNLLRSILGSWAPAVFAVALIAAGQSSTITGTLAGQVVMEGYLDIRLKPWLRRLLTRSAAIIPALVAIFYFGENSLSRLLVLSQVVLSLQLGFAVIPLLHFTASKKLMGRHSNSFWLSSLGWLCAIVIVGLNMRFLLTEGAEWLHDSHLDKKLLYLVILPLCTLAVLVLAYLVIEPFVKKVGNIARANS